MLESGGPYPSPRSFGLPFPDPNRNACVNARFSLMRWVAIDEMCFAARKAETVGFDLITVITDIAVIATLLSMFGIVVVSLSLL